MSSLLLIVHDETRRRRYRQWLTEASPGFTVHEAATSAAALAHCAQGAPACVVLDAVLPEAPAEVVRALRAGLPVLPPLLLLTPKGHNVSADAEALFEDILETEVLNALRLRRAAARLVEMDRLRQSLRQESERRRLLQDQVETLQADLESAREAQSQFLADKTHDLRSPLNAMIGYSELLQEELRDRGQDDLMADVKRIRSVSQRLLGVVADLSGNAEKLSNLPEDSRAALDEALRAGPHRTTQPSDEPTQPHETQATHVLIIDDDDDLRNMMALFLESEGYSVETASDGESGLQAARHLTPAAITLDVHMPGMDGWAVLRTLKADPALSPIPVLMLTGRGNERIAARALRQGVDDYLIKGDISALGLHKALQGVLEKARLRRAIEEAQRALIWANETLEERVAAQTGQIRSLASSLTLAEQRERQRIAQVLHDHLQQHLYGLNLRLQLALRKIGAETQPTLHDQLTYMERMVAEAIQMTRTLSVELSPPVLQNEAMRATLEWLAVQMEETHGLRVSVAADDPGAIPGREMRVLLFQLIRELLFNVVKHASVKAANISLRKEQGHLYIAVEDEGKGFDVEKQRNTPQTRGGWGLGSMEERLSLFRGTLNVTSKAGHGTRITIGVPADMLGASNVPKASAPRPTTQEA